MREKILVVDDDKEIAFAIKRKLELENYQIDLAFDGQMALEKIQGNQYDLLILDVMMPRLDGLSLTIKLRENNNIPIIILSAKSEQTDMILGLQMGADDYLPKPFNPDFLVAKVRALLRRNNVFGQTNDEIIKIKSLVLNNSLKIVTIGDDVIKLTALEFKILAFLMKNANHVFSATEIYQNVWDDEECYAVENTVMVHIRHIREKIELDPRNPEYLKVVWGIGYKIENNR